MGNTAPVRKAPFPFSSSWVENQMDRDPRWNALPPETARDDDSSRGRRCGTKQLDEVLYESSCWLLKGESQVRIIGGAT